MVFHWSLNDGKSPQVSRTRLRILAVLNNVVVWMVSTHPPTSNYYYYYSLEFFSSALVDGFSLESEWQQVSSSLQDSSQDSGRSQQCCHLDSLYPSATFQDLQAF